MNRQLILEKRTESLNQIAPIGRQPRGDTTPHIEGQRDRLRIFPSRECDFVHRVHGPDLEIRPTRLRQQPRRLHHQKDIADFEKEASSGNDPDLKNWASKTLPTLRPHLAEAQSLLK